MYGCHPSVQVDGIGLVFPNPLSCQRERALQVRNVVMNPSPVRGNHAQGQQPISWSARATVATRDQELAIVCWQLHSVSHFEFGDKVGVDRRSRVSGHVALRDSEASAEHFVSRENIGNTQNGIVG